MSVTQEELRTNLEKMKASQEEKRTKMRAGYNKMKVAINSQEELKTALSVIRSAQTKPEEGIPK
jgi:hypothetical protein